MLCRVCAGILLAALSLRADAAPPRLLPHATPGHMAEALLDDRNWVRFGLSDGLPSEQILDLLELPSGDVWVRTAAGLAWYDGFSFHRAGADLGLPESGFLSFAEAVSGGLWILYESGIYAGGASGFQRLALPLPPSDPVASHAAPMPGRGMLVITSTGATYLWDGSRLTALPAGLRSLHWASRRLHVTRPGEVWLSTSAGIVRVGPSSWDVALPAPVNPQTGEQRTIDIYSLDAAPGHGGSFAVNLMPFDVSYWEWYPGKPPRRIPELSGHVIGALAVAPDGERVVVNRDGDILTGRGRQWTRLVFRPMALRNVSYLRFRGNGELWSATGHGLYLWRRTGQLWNQAMPSYNELTRTVHDILFRPDGSLWLATMNGLAIRSPKGEWRLLNSFGGTRFTMVTGVREDESGNVWVVSGAGFGGAWRWDGRSWRHFGEREGLTSAYIHRIYRARDGALWFLSSGVGAHSETLAAGAYRLSNETFERWGVGRGLASSQVMSMAEGPQGEIYFGTRRGVSRYHSGKWRHWDRRTGVYGAAVFTMAADRQGTLWFSNRTNGLFSLAGDGTLRRIGVTEGLAGSEIWEIRLDPRDRLWASTQSGLSLLENGHWTRFHSSSGLDNVHLWPIAFRGDEVCVGSLGGGLYCTQPSRQAARHTRAVLLEPETKSAFTILRWRPVSAWGADPPSEIRMRHRMDGGPWSEWGSRGELAVAGLSPGQHTFQVQTRGPLETAPTTTGLSFRVPLPFFLRWEFFVPVSLLAATVLLLLAVLARRRMRYQREVARSEARFRAIVDNSADIVSIVDRQGRLIYSNKALEKRLGYTQRELVALGLNVVHDDDRPAVQLALDTANAHPGRVIQAPHRCRHHNGAYRWMEMELVNLLHVPGVNGIVAHVRDVTDRREFQDKLAEAKQQAEQASKAKTEFLTTMSHEVRTPMNGILGMCGLLEETRLDPTQREYAGIIRGSAQSLLAIVNDVLDLSRIEAGKMVLAREPFSLRVVCQESIDLLRPRALEQKIALILDYPPSPAAHYLGDAARIRQVVLNLLGNAVKFTHTGGVTLRVSSRAAASVHHVRIEVIDTGIGIARELLPSLFEKFTQADSSNSRRYGGSGLGLSISRSLVERMGGRIAAESEPGKGSRFWFELPLPVTTLAPAAPEPSHGLPHLPKARVLVVEDNPVNQMVVARMLGRLGLHIESAANGREALELLTRSHYDIVLMDCQMPEMDGYEATAAIRKSENGSRRTPIIALTANAMEGERDRCLASGMDDYVAKPVEIANLCQVLERWLPAAPPVGSLTPSQPAPPAIPHA